MRGKGGSNEACMHYMISITFDPEVFDRIQELVSDRGGGFNLSRPGAYTRKKPHTINVRSSNDVRGKKIFSLDALSLSLRDICTKLLRLARDLRFMAPIKLQEQPQKVSHSECAAGPNV